MKRRGGVSTLEDETRTTTPRGRGEQAELELGTRMDTDVRYFLPCVFVLFVPPFLRSRRLSSDLAAQSNFAQNGPKFARSRWQSSVRPCWRRQCAGTVDRSCQLVLALRRFPPLSVVV